MSKKTIDLSSQEYKLTLDQIAKDNPKLLLEFRKEFNCAFNKAKYYEIIADIFNNKKKQARYKLRAINTSKIEYFLLYLILFMPVSKRLILKLLGR